MDAFIHDVATGGFKHNTQGLLINLGSNVMNESFVFLCIKVDKGTAGLGGTDGETTIQGNFLPQILLNMTVIYRDLYPF